MTITSEESFDKGLNTNQCFSIAPKRCISLLAVIDECMDPKL